MANEPFMSPEAYHKAAETAFKNVSVAFAALFKAEDRVTALAKETGEYKEGSEKLKRIQKNLKEQSEKLQDAQKGFKLATFEVDRLNMHINIDRICMDSAAGIGK